MFDERVRTQCSPEKSHVVDVMVCIPDGYTWTCMSQEGMLAEHARTEPVPLNPRKLDELLRTLRSANEPRRASVAFLRKDPDQVCNLI